MGDFKAPTWAGKPPPGMHLDVCKNDTLLQKLLIDDKKYYLFGRNKDQCDFPLDHQSCSRLHAALIYHKHLDRFFIMDLGSTHGTFIGSIRLELQKPQQVPVDSVLSFGASTRTYTLRERPKQVKQLNAGEGEREGGGGGGVLLGIMPEDDTEMDDLTLFNTAHNRQISMLGIAEEEPSARRKRKSASVNFSDTEEIINPEDIDPTIGKFRNMVQTAVIPTKRVKLDTKPDEVATSPTVTTPTKVFTQPSVASSLYQDTGLPLEEIKEGFGGSAFNFGISALGLRPISSAPPVDEAQKVTSPTQVQMSPVGLQGSLSPTTPPPLSDTDAMLPRKKKYAKEVWPGRKPTHLLV